MTALDLHPRPPPCALGHQFNPPARQVNMFYLLAPDVPGFLGEPTVLDTTVRPPRVVGTLHYEIDNWFGDDLITSHPCYLVTEKMASALAGSGLGRFEIRDVEVTYGEDAHERLLRHGVNDFPEFGWLYVTGTASQDDVGLTQRGRLVVSDVALEIFRQGNLNRCEIEEYGPSRPPGSESGSTPRPAPVPR